MADTIGGGDFGKCADCGADHAPLIHWGPLVPNGKRTVLCGKCMGLRGRWLQAHREPLPVPMPKEVLVGEVMDA